MSAYSRTCLKGVAEFGYEIGLLYDQDICRDAINRVSTDGVYIVIQQRRLKLPILTNCKDAKYTKKEEKKIGILVAVRE